MWVNKTDQSHGISRCTRGRTGRINDLALVLTTSRQPNQLQLSFMNVNTKPKEIGCLANVGQQNRPKSQNQSAHSRNAGGEIDGYELQSYRSARPWCLMAGGDWCWVLDTTRVSRNQSSALRRRSWKPSRLMMESLGTVVDETRNATNEETASICSHL
jgi:hypothetical protein